MSAVLVMYVWTCRSKPNPDCTHLDELQRGPNEESPLDDRYCTAARSRRWIEKADGKVELRIIRCEHRCNGIHRSRDGQSWNDPKVSS